MGVQKHRLVWPQCVWPAGVRHHLIVDEKLPDVLFYHGTVTKWTQVLWLARSLRQMSSPQSTVRKKDANCTFYHNTLRTATVNGHTDSGIFFDISPCTDNTVYAMFEVFRTFLCVCLMRITLINVRLTKLWVRMGLIGGRWVLSPLCNPCTIFSAYRNILLNFQI